MRIASLDLGSNSFYLLVVEARLDGTFSPLAREKEMLRLGDLVAATGRIGPEAIGRAVRVIRRFKAVADAKRADEIVALGTAALREARDGGAFVDRVREATGIEIEIVDGIREAELIFRAVRSSVVLEPAPALAADLGGGSLELMVGDRGGLSFATSLRLGVGRLTAELVSSDPLVSADWARLRERVEAELRPVLEDEVADLSPRMLVGSSGTFLCLARMAVALREGSPPDGLNQLSVPSSCFQALADAIRPLSVDERQRMPGCDARRAELVPAGIVVLEQLFASTGLAELTLSEWALREGAVLELIGDHDRAEIADDPRSIRRTSVLALCRRSGWRQRHARQVASLCLELFDVLGPAHGLSGHDRELLELGALLHDIGEHVARADHDRHSAYLIENGGLRGFSPDEIRILSVLGRFHVRGTPKGSFGAFGALAKADRSRASRLVSILRLGDALDASHSDLVGGLSLERTDRPSELRLVARVRGDAELEQWMFRRKKDLFDRLFGTEISLVVEPSGRSSLDLAHEDVSGLA